MNTDRAYEWALGAEQDERWAYVGLLTLKEHQSVGIGHRLVAETMPLLHEDVGSVWRLRSGQPLEPKRLRQMLNEPPTRAFQREGNRLEVVGWGIWASRFQASVLEAVKESFEFQKTMLGDKDGAREYLDVMAQDYSALAQFPILRLRLLQQLKESDPRVDADAARFVQAHPERVSDANFVCLSTGNCGAVSRSVPSYRDWLTLVVPFGTLYNAGRRCWQMPEVKRFTRAEIAEWRRVNPYDPWMMGWSLRMIPGPWKPEDINQAFGNLKDFGGTFYAGWMTKAYPAATPEQVSLLQTLADVSPGYYFSLARTFVALERYGEAERAYLKGRELSGDAVQVANHMRWLVLRLERTGRHALAETIAEESASVYSSGGLQAMATLREAQGRLKEAEAWLKKDSERYGQDKELHAFYRRNATAEPQYREQGGRSGREALPPRPAEAGHHSGDEPTPQGGQAPKGHSRDGERRHRPARHRRRCRRLPGRERDAVRNHSRHDARWARRAGRVPEGGVRNPRSQPRRSVLRGGTGGLRTRRRAAVGS